MALDTGETPKLQTVDPNQYSIRAEKDLEKSNVNWSKVAADVTDVVDKVRDDRQKRKDELDNATTTAMNNLNEITPVDNQTLGTMVLNTSNASKEALQIQNNLMKQGKLKPNDYMKFQQRLSDQWSSWNTSVKNWDQSYKTAMERVQNGTASSQEIFINELTQSFGNVNGLQMYVNPQSGDMSLVRLNEDGSMPDPKKNPDAFMSMNYINQRMNQQVDAVDVSAEVAPSVERFANVIRMEINNSNGAYTSYEDFRQMPDFEKMINDQVNAFTTDPNNVASILSDNVGGYSFTQNAAEAKNDPTKIFLENNSNGQLIPKLTEDQLKVAQDYTRTAMESQLDSKMDYDKGARFAPKSKTAAEISAGRQDELAQSYLNSIDLLITGTPEDADSGGQNLIDEVNKNRGKDAPEVKNITRTADGNFIIETSEKTVTVDGKNKSAEQIRREIYSAVTPTGTVTYDAIRSGDLTGDIGVGTGGGTVGVEKVQWRRDPKIGDRTFTTQDWVDTMPSLGDNLGTGDNLPEVKNQFTQLINTNGFLPDEFRNKGENNIVMDGNKMTVIIQGTPYKIDGNIMNYTTGQVVTRIQNFIEKEVKKRNEGISSGELD